MSTPAPRELARSGAGLFLPAVPRVAARKTLLLVVTVALATAGLALAVSGGLLALGMVHMVDSRSPRSQEVRDGPVRPSRSFDVHRVRYRTGVPADTGARAARARAGTGHPPGPPDARGLVSSG